MVTVGMCLTNASAMAGAPSCPPSTASSLESAGHVPKANCEGALVSLPPLGTVLPPPTNHLLHQLGYLAPGEPR